MTFAVYGDPNSSPSSLQPLLIPAGATSAQQPIAPLASVDPQTDLLTLFLSIGVRARALQPPPPSLRLTLNGHETKINPRVGVVAVSDGDDPNAVNAWLEPKLHEPGDVWSYLLRALVMRSSGLAGTTWSIRIDNNEMPPSADPRRREMFFIVADTDADYDLHMPWPRPLQIANPPEYLDGRPMSGVFVGQNTVLRSVTSGVDAPQ